MPQIQFWLFQSDIRVLREYHERVQEFLQAQIEKFNDEFNESLEDQLELDRGWDIDNEIDRFNELSEEMPAILRTTVLVAAYSRLEALLLSLCDGFRGLKQLQLAPKDLRDSGIFAAKTYFTKVAHVSFPSDTSEWAEFQFVNKLRNILVHSDGRVKPTNDTLCDQIADDPRLSVTDSGYLQLTDAFVDQTLELIGRFANLVQKAVESGDPNRNGRA